jgi:hypothetical protein
VIFTAPSDEPAQFPAIPGVAAVALVVSAILIVYLGILPARVLEWAATASISTIN